MNIQLITELFDSEGSLEAVNMKPKAKIPYLWKIQAPGNDNLYVRIGSFDKTSDVVKVPRAGDKHYQIFLLSLSDKGNGAELRNGLGTKPIDVLNTIIDTVYPVIKRHRVETVAFRFPTKKMKGQVPVLNRILERIVKAKSKGTFELTNTIEGPKTSFALLKAKNADFSSMGVDTDDLEEVQAALLRDEVKKSYTSVINNTKLSKAEILTLQNGDPIGMTASTNKTEEDLWLSELPSIPLIDKDLNRYISQRFIDKINDFTRYGHIADLGNASSILTDFANEVSSKGNILDHRIWNDLFNKLNKEGENLDEDTIGELVGQIVKLYAGSIREYYDLISNEFRNSLTVAQKDSIKKYTGDAYESINASLRRDDYDYGDCFTKKKTDIFINDLDSCFTDSPCTLPGVSVYRSHRMLSNSSIETLMNTKLFYFRNYVSTSLSPYIMSFDISQSMRGEKESNMVMFIIELDDRVPVLVPGSLSNFQNEVEVILPRGTVLKVDRFSQGKILAAYCKVVPISELTEEEQQEYMYMKFKDFINEKVVDKKTDKKVHDYFPKRDDLPERFFD